MNFFSRIEILLIKLIIKQLNNFKKKNKFLKNYKKYIV